MNLIYSPKERILAQLFIKPADIRILVNSSQASIFLMNVSCLLGLQNTLKKVASLHTVKTKLKTTSTNLAFLVRKPGELKLVQQGLGRLWWSNTVSTPALQHTMNPQWAMTFLHEVMRYIIDCHSKPKLTTYFCNKFVQSASLQMREDTSSIIYTLSKEASTSCFSSRHVHLHKCSIMISSISPQAKWPPAIPKQPLRHASANGY